MVEGVGAVHVEVALPAEVIKLTEDEPMQLILDGQVVAPLDGAVEAELEVPQSNIAEDASDLVHGRSERGDRSLACRGTGSASFSPGPASGLR